MRAFVAVVAVGLLTACTVVASHAPAATSAQPSIIARASPTPTAQTAPPFPLPQLTRVGFSCRLPVIDSRLFPFSFVDFPTRQPTPANSPGYIYYDEVVNRWLSAPRDVWSPDRRQYAIADPPQQPRYPQPATSAATLPAPTHVHIVDAATGADVRVYTMPDTKDYFVLEFTTKGVELAASAPGVWRLDPTTGRVAKVSEGFYAPEDEWIGTWDPRDALPSPASGYGYRNPADRIDHRDADGTATTWFYRPGKVLTWLPFVGSTAVLVEVGTDDGVEYWLVSGPNRSTRLAGYSQNGQQTLPLTDMDTGGFYRAVADMHGIWLGGGSIYLITVSGAIERVDNQGGYPAGICA